jgi:hypothetical protein
MNVFALEPFYGRSHRAFLDGWVAYSRHDWTVSGLSPITGSGACATARSPWPSGWRPRSPAARGRRRRYRRRSASQSRPEPPACSFSSSLAITASAAWPVASISSGCSAS